MTDRNVNARHTMTVITWATTRDTVNICTTCEARLEAAGKWPKDHTGEEYASVSHGAHRGMCDLIVEVS